MKIRSLLLGSVALAGLSTAGYAADLGIVVHSDFDSGGHDFDSFLKGGASTNAMAVAMTPDGHFGLDPGGHTSAGIGDMAMINGGDLLVDFQAYPGGSGVLGDPGGSETHSAHGAKPVIPAGGHATPS